MSRSSMVTELSRANEHALCPLTCSPPSSEHLSASILHKLFNMKDVSTNSKHVRISIYPKKRPSPHGVTKLRKAPTPLQVSHTPVRKTPPPSAKTILLQQRQREAHMAALRRDAIYLE